MSTTDKTSRPAEEMPVEDRFLLVADIGDAQVGTTGCKEEKEISDSRRLRSSSGFTLPSVLCFH